MKTLKRIGPGTFAVPENKFGIFAVHCDGEPPLSEEFIKEIIDGPVTRAQLALREELARPVLLAD